MGLESVLSPLADLKVRFEATRNPSAARVATSKGFDETTGKIAKGKKCCCWMRNLLSHSKIARSMPRSESAKSRTRKFANPRPFTTSTLQQEATASCG
ncbi:MAG: hypothetical protein U0528_19225 [Anaerolineae bacterium]